MKRFLFLILSGLFFMGSINAQTGYSNNFETNPGWTGDNQYSVSHEDSVMHISVNKFKNWAGLWIDLPSSYDIQSNPYVNLKIKASPPVKFHLYLFNSSNENEIVAKRVPAADGMTNICFDFSSASSAVLSDVTAMIFAVNGAATSYSGDFYVDDLMIGTDASQFANIGGIPDQAYFLNTATKTITITDLENADNISVSQTGSLIQSISTTAIQSNNTAELSFDLVTDATGSGTITVTANGSTGWDNNSYTFDLTVEDNIAPTIDAISDQQAPVGVEQTIDLSGLSDGNLSAAQDLTISASSDDPVALPGFSVNYDQGSPYGTLLFTPASEASGVTVTVTVEDDGTGSNTTTEDFMVDIFSNYNNAPTIDDKLGQQILITAGEQTIQLSGITDGDGGSQNISVTATSSLDSILGTTTPTVNYTSGDKTAGLVFTPNAIGTTTISVTVSDDGDNGSNNGDMSTDMSFDIEIIPEPATGHIVPMSEFDTTNPRDISNVGDWMIEKNDTAQFCTLGTFHGRDDVIRIETSDKSCWTGLWYKTPDLDLSQNNALISYDMYVDGSTDYLTHVYFYDAEDERNANVAHDHGQTITAGQWNSFTFDYRQPNEMENNSGEPLNDERIQKILINYASNFDWPFPSDNMTIYISNIRIGDEAENIPAFTPYCTIDDVGNKVYIEDPGQKQITLSNITDGATNAVTPTVTATSSNTGFLPDPTVSSVDADGEATLTFTPGTGINTSTVTVTVSATGSQDQVVTFDVQTVSSDPVNADTLTIDLTTEYQTIRGFGTKDNKESLLTLYTENLGASAMRIAMVSNQIEIVNDNSDPNVLNRDNLNYDAFDWDYFRKLKENGVETFILTSWTPPAWMKDNLSRMYQGPGAPNWEDTDNRLSTWYYEEYAEMFVALVKMFKEESGIDLYAVGPQNEPAFNEPYGSAILDPAHFVDLIKILGPRFESEGINTKIYMPEQVFSQAHYSMDQYMDAVQADAVANQYTDIIAVHSYGESGITQDNPTYTGWQNMWSNAQEGAYPKELWMTETSGLPTDWTSGGLPLAGSMHGALKYGNISLWTWWGIENAYIQQGKITPLGDGATAFYKFIRPGAKRVDCDDSGDQDILATAYKNDAANYNKIVVVAINKGTSPLTVVLDGNNMPSKINVYKASANNPFQRTAVKAGTDVIALDPESVTTIVGWSNNPPTINQVSSQENLQADGEQTISLSGITDGDDGSQGLTVTASSNNSNVNNVSVDYTSPNSTGSLFYTPNTAGTSVITVTVKDDGGSTGGGVDSTTISFNVNVYSDWNNKPTISSVATQTIYEDDGQQTLELAGISDGDGGSQTVTISASSSNTDLIPHPSVTYSSGATGVLSYTPQAERNGTAIITLNVGDDGGTATNNGNQSIQSNFTINVEPVNDAPTFDAISNDTTYIDSALQAITITGISDGDDGNQSLSFSLRETDADLVNGPIFIYTDGDATAELQYSPKTSVGSTDVTVILKDDGGTDYNGVDSATTTFTITVMSTDDMKVINAGEIKVYPNPVSDLLIIEIQDAAINSMIISDITGSTVINKEIDPGTKQINLNVNALNSGLYNISLFGSKEVYKAQFIVQ